MSQGCILLILRSKGQGHLAWLIVNGFRTITDSNQPMIMKLHALTSHEARQAGDVDTFRTPGLNMKRDFYLDVYTILNWI